MTGNAYYEKFKSELGELSIHELIERFNSEVGNQGWTTARASYLAAIHQEFNNRGIDYSEIGDEHKLSFKNKIELTGKVIFKVS